MPPSVTAGVLPSVPGLLITVWPSQLHTVTHQPAQATWQGVQGPLGDSGQVVQLPHVLQLPSAVRLPPLPAPCPSAYGQGQQVVMGTLVPHQPVGLGPWDVGQGQPLYPTGCTVLNVPAHAGPLPPQHPAAQHCVQVPPVLCTHPGSAQKLLEAFNNDVVASEDGIPAATPCQPALDMLSGRSRTKHQGEVCSVAEPIGGDLHQGRLASPWGWLGFVCFFRSGDHPAKPRESPGPAQAGARCLQRGLS